MALLQGLRVLDFSLGQAGAQASQLLSDFGAEVIMIEPAEGSPLRKHRAFPFWCRGKKSIVLDLTQDREVILNLARSADVVIDSGRPGSLNAKGLGYDDLSRDNPGLVYCSISGFGSQGPYADAPGYEGLVAARLGIYHIFRAMRPMIPGIGFSDKPAFVSTPFASFAAAQIATQGIFAALHERERSGRGQKVEASLGLSLLALDTWAWIEHVLVARWPDAFSAAPNFDSEERPLSHLMFRLLVCQTSEGDWLQFASTAPRLYNAMIRALGMAGLKDDPEFASAPTFDDPAAGLRFWTRMIESAKDKSLADWEDIFDTDQDVFGEQFRAGSLILDHPQLLHDGMSITLRDAERGEVRQFGALVGAPHDPAVFRSAPLLDEHRAEVLGRGWSGEPLPQPAPTSEPATDMPLQGITIVDFGSMFAAPQGATLLTELGARVIKIEPLEGDSIRNVITIPESGAAHVMQGKESICLNLTTAEGRAIALDLVSRADIVLQGFRGDVMARLGLDFPSVKAVNPKIVYVNAPGYGVTGPYAKRPAYAPSIGAAAGFSLTNLGYTTVRREPLSVEEIRPLARRLSAAGAQAQVQADGIAASAVGTAMIFGLYARDRGAGAQELFTSMLNSNTHMNCAVAVDWENSPPAPIVDTDLNGFGPLYRMYDTADGYVFLAAPTAHDWSRLCEALADHGDLRGDARFGDETARQVHAADLVEALSAIFVKQSAIHWEQALLPKGVGCVEVARSPTEALLLDTDLGRDSGYLARVVDPLWDEMDRRAALVRLSRSATQAKPACLPGQHSDAILAEIGFSEEQIAEAREAGIVG